MGKLKVAVLAATGMVGQQYVRFLADHPLFEPAYLYGRESAGKKYGEAVRWTQPTSIPKKVRDLEVRSTKAEDIEADLIISPLPTEAAREIEPGFAKRGFPVVSDAAAHRMEEDVPLLIPEVNPEHLELIEVQRKRRSWKGFIATTPNCTAAGLALVLKPLHDAFRIKKAVVATLQATSGAGYPGVPSLDIMDNVIPFISGEEEKVETETRKILGNIHGGSVEEADFQIAACCHRVPTIDGHMESVYLECESPLKPEEAKEVLRSFKGLPQKLGLPMAPREPIVVLEEADRPQTRLDRLAGTVPGMAVTVGRVRQGLDGRSLRLTLLSHNTIRGAAGSTILLAELMVAQRILRGG